MEMDRRSLLKSVLAGGTLVTLGVPSWTFAEQPSRRAGRYALLLGGTGTDEAFAQGVRAAWMKSGYGRLSSFDLKGALLSEPDEVTKLLNRLRETRWIAVTDEAGAVVFQELTRSAGGRLLSAGSHVACVEEDRGVLRHVWLTSSPTHGVAGLLAAQLDGAHDTVSVVERFLDTSSAGGELVAWSAPGFASYRSAGPESTHLHCSGLSLLEGRRLLGLPGTEEWSPIPRQRGREQRVARPAHDWAESVGYAVAASAFGMNQVRETCAGRAFVHRSHGGQRTQPAARFVSFVMDL